MKSLVLLSSEGFMPHGHCFLWRPDILWLHIVSDAIVFIAYMMIPIIILMLLRKRTTLPYKWIVLMFGLFITLCGFTHLLAIITIWIPIYFLEGVIKAITAAVSIATALLIIPLAPKAFNYILEKTDELSSKEQK
jgi:hypothetical protein